MNRRRAVIATVSDVAVTLLLAVGAGAFAGLASPSINQTTLTLFAALTTSGLPFLLLLERDVTMPLIVFQVGAILLNVYAGVLSLGGGKHLYSPFLLLINLTLGAIGVIHLNTYRALHRHEKTTVPTPTDSEPPASDRVPKEALQCKLSALSSAQSLLFPLAVTLGLRALVFAQGSWVLSCVWAPVFLVACVFLWIIGGLESLSILRAVSLACFAITLFLAVLLTVELNHCINHTYTACLISILEPYLFAVWVATIYLVTLYTYLITKSVLHYARLVSAAARKRKQA